MNIMKDRNMRSRGPVIISAISLACETRDTRTSTVMLKTAEQEENPERGELTM